MGRMCNFCGGLVMQPGVAYGYVGPVCSCMSGYQRDRYQVPPFVNPPAYTIKPEMPKPKTKVQQVVELCNGMDHHEIYALIKLLTALHDAHAISSKPPTK